jgi:hypothetical protein
LQKPRAEPSAIRPPPGDAEYRKRKDFRHDRHVRMKEAAN